MFLVPRYTKVNAKVELKSSLCIGAIIEISLKSFTLGVKARKKNNFFNLSLYGLDLTQRQKKYTYQVGSPNCNPWGQCCYNYILLFWWNSHLNIKVNPKPNLISSTSLVSSPLIELLCLFVNDGRSFYSFLFWICQW
jgi:hypothetical protein